MFLFTIFAISYPNTYAIFDILYLTDVCIT